MRSSGRFDATGVAICNFEKDQMEKFIVLSLLILRMVSCLEN